MDCVGHMRLCANIQETGPLHYPPVRRCSVILHEHQTMAISKAMGHIKLVM
jgi:hypothetical protein